MWKHQKLVARFLSAASEYNAQLFFHKPGTGKTCAAAAVAEINKSAVKKHCLVIVKNDRLAEQWKAQIALTCTGGQYKPEDWENLKPTLKVTRLNKAIGTYYEVVTMDKLSRMINDIKSDKQLEKQFSNRVIIIDEAHNLRIETKTKEQADETRTRYKAFHRMLHAITNVKIIMLTGTPIYDKITEFPTIMNLILPIDKQLPVDKAFITEYVNTESEPVKLKNVDKLKKHIIGYVSYIREGGNFPTRKDLGKNVWTKFIKTVNLEMSDIQLEGYRKAFKQDSADKQYRENSRQAAVFVYKKKDDTLLWGKAASDELTVEVEPSQKLKKLLQTEGKQRKAYLKFKSDKIEKDLHDNLQLYSPKYNAIIEFLTEHPNDPTFIFTPHVSGAGGAIFLGLVLQLFGYSRAIGDISVPAKRYAIITGDQGDKVERKKLIETFNSPDNRDGKLIQVMIATKTISEGISFINVLHEIIVSPYWNNSATEQAIGRGLRADSLLYKPLGERIVTVQQLAITSEEFEDEERENIDAILYKLSEYKDYQIKLGERVLKEAAWDCPFNYARNIRTTDVDYSRNCEYQKCNYACYQLVPDKSEKIWKYNVSKEELDNSNYLLLYAGEELADIIEKISLVFAKSSFINISGLYEKLAIEDFKMLVLALEYMIENNVKVRNKWGVSCFLRKSGNTLFLTDSPANSDILLSWYSRFPFIISHTPLDVIVDNEIYSADSEIIGKIDLDEPPENTRKLFDNLSLESKIFVLEWILKLPKSDMTPAQKQNYDKLLKLFEKHYYISDEVIAHDMEKIEVKYDYIDFTKGGSGILRCLSGFDWDVCDKKSVEAIKKIKSTKTTSEDEIINNKWRIYAIATEDGNIRIADKSKETGTGGHKRYRGKLCTQGWDKWQLIELFIRLNINFPQEELIEETDKKELLEIISNNKASEAIPENPTIEQLKLIATLSDKSIHIPELCQVIQQWFVDNNLVIYS